MDTNFDIDPEIFHDRKRRRITAMNNQEPPAPTVAPTSMPAVHEIATFLPGRLEFEHEIDNEAEDLVKDLEFGVVYDYGGDEIVEDENDLDVKARQKWEEEKRSGVFTGTVGVRDHASLPAGKGPPPVNGMVNGYHMNGDVKKLMQEDASTTNGSADDEAEEPLQPQPYETKDSIAFKLTLLEMYYQRVDKRLETKAVIFERGLLDYKKVCGIHYYYFFSLQVKRPSLSRCKLQRRNGHERNANSFTGCVPLQDCKLRKTMRHSQLICSVRSHVAFAH